MKGYKVFDPDWTCRGFQYEVGKTYEIEDKPILCKRGFHFCEKAVDCFEFYDFFAGNKVAEVEALGEVIGDGCKSCTNKISIIRELSWEEVQRIVNMGRGCTGRGNSGDHNSGDNCSGSYNSGNYCSGSCNSGWYNSGDWNSGDWNSGNRNTGDWNSGNGNSGNRNSGRGNSGSYNSGDNCSGDWNATNGSAGCFNTKSDKIRMFNEPTDWTLADWRTSEACAILGGMPVVSNWVGSVDMTDDEKAKHPEAETTGGYLKETDNAVRQKWWDSLSDYDKATVKSIPNFDAEIFEQITGIKV